MFEKSFGNSLLVLVFLFDFGTSVPSIRNGDSNTVNDLDSNDLSLESSIFLAKDNSKCETDTPPDPSSDCCGVQVKTKQKRNIGGEETLLTEYPWLVLLEYPTKLNAICAGFLISGRHVITAAHCISHFKEEPNNVRLGDHDRIAKGYDCMTVEEGRKVCDDGTTSIPIRKITVHPEFNRTDSWHNDIAILELDQLAPYTDFIRPICLPSSDVTNTSNSSELKFHFAGFGVIAQIHSSIRKVYRNVFYREKLKSILPYKSNEECQRAFDQNIKTNVTIRTTNICAGGEYLKGPCQGDSGGPLMYDNNGVFEVAGVFSFGPVGPCGMKDVPAAFIKIYEYQTWIRSVVNA